MYHALLLFIQDLSDDLPTHLIMIHVANYTQRDKLSYHLYTLLLLVRCNSRRL